MIIQSERFKLISYHEKEDKLYMPNEIFKDLKQSITTGNHLAFAYSYYYFLTYLYRYCKFDFGNKFTQADIITFLGYNSSARKTGYLMTRGGILDQMGYTKTTTDYPVLWSLDEHKKVTFTCVKEYKKMHGKDVPNINPNLRVKIPVKAFHREGSNVLDGTFYDVSNTHSINMRQFVSAMDNEEIGVTGFYIYGFLLMQAKKFPNGYITDYPNFGKELGLGKNTVLKYITSLNKHRFVQVKNMGHKKPNSYIALP